jgi:hypothetical protein
VYVHSAGATEVTGGSTGTEENTGTEGGAEGNTGTGIEERAAGNAGAKGRTEETFEGGAMEGGAMEGGARLIK